MFPLPRILYAMACDGLLFSVFSDIHPKFQTPLLATLLSGLLAGKQTREVRRTLSEQVTG
jgi:amino acid transporter